MMFYWDDWNRRHVRSHGVSREEAIFVVRRAQPPYPQDAGDGKFLVCGPTLAGRLVQVIFAFTSPDRMDYEQMSFDDILQLEKDAGPYVYVIHARDLTASEKGRLLKRRR